MSTTELSQRTILQALLALRDQEAEINQWFANAEEFEEPQNEALVPKVEAILEKVRDAIEDLERSLADKVRDAINDLERFLADRPRAGPPISICCRGEERRKLMKADD